MTKKAAFIDDIVDDVEKPEIENTKKTTVHFDLEVAFERMSDWLEKKKVANWVIMLAAVYIFAQIIRAIF
jgi:hypothetical protein